MYSFLVLYVLFLCEEANNSSKLYHSILTVPEERPPLFSLRANVEEIISQVY